MASYAELLAEEIQKQAANNETSCYHDLDRQRRVDLFTICVVEFCQKYHIRFWPQDR